MGVRAFKFKTMQDAGIAGMPVLAGSEYYLYAAGSHTSTNNATNTITVRGARAGDLALCQLDTKGSTPRTILTGKVTKDLLTIVFSGAPATDHIVSWSIWKPRNPTQASRRVY